MEVAEMLTDPAQVSAITLLQAFTHPSYCSVGFGTLM
jgi:hypothetical protein